MTLEPKMKDEKITKIIRFIGQFAFLSNFHPILIEYEGAKYPSVENAYQASKTLNKTLRKEFEKISPGEAKKKGKQLKIRKDWNDETKISIMLELLRQKFDRASMKEELLKTGDLPIVEGKHWGDKFWGQCPPGEGKNHLGILLMNIRKELRDGKRG